jgi:hypothetical protein
VLLEWTQKNASPAVIIPVGVFEARRVRWTYRREFRGQPVRVVIASVDASPYTRTNWWTDEFATLSFQNEILKFIYYILKY